MVRLNLIQSLPLIAALLLPATLTAQERVKLTVCLNDHVDFVGILIPIIVKQTLFSAVMPGPLHGVPGWTSG